MTTRRTPLKIAFPGLLLRELCKAGIRLADAMDPAGSATEAWGRRSEIPDHVPDALLVRW